MKCPGQDTRYWKPNDIYEAKCPECGADVEFFKDDPTRRCRKCGHQFLNPSMNFGCAAYCRHAAECIGNLPAQVIAQKEDLLKDRVAIEMKRYFGRDFKRISHSIRTARYAEHIGKNEPGADLSVILCAAYLHDIGIPEAERKYRSTKPKYQHTEGPPAAKMILEKLDAKQELIKEVCDIIGHHHNRDYNQNTNRIVNFRVLYDADLIANCEDDNISLEKIKKLFLTKSGAEYAEEWKKNENKKKDNPN